MNPYLYILYDKINELKNKPIAEYVGNPEYITIPAQIKILKQMASEMKKTTIECPYC